VIGSDACYYNVGKKDSLKYGIGKMEKLRGRVVIDRMDVENKGLAARSTAGP